MHAHELNRALVDRGVEIEVATLWRTNRRDWLRGTTVSAPPPRPPDVLDGVRVFNLGLSGRRRMLSALPATSYYAAMRSTAPHLAGIFRPLAELVADRSRPTLAHLHRIGREWFYEAFIRALTARGVPFVLTPYHHPHWTRRRDWWWWDIYRRAAAVCVFTDSEAAAVIDGGVDPSKVHRVPSGPVRSSASPTPPGAAVLDETEPRVLFLGQVKPYKGLDVVYDAMQLVWRRHRDARLIVAGPWLLRDSVQLRRILEADPRVDVLGRVSSDAKWRELRRARMLCVPSTQESLGIVYLEAWLAGRPVIGADIPPVRELFARTGGGLSVTPEPFAVASAISALLTDGELARNLARSGGHAVATEYNWRVAAERTLAVYRSVGALF